MKYYKPINSSDEERVIPKDQYAIHFLGIKPWACYKDYDCNWHFEGYLNFASDQANTIWWKVYNEMPKMLQSYCGMTESADARLRQTRSRAQQAKLKNGHWDVEIKDPRQYDLVKT